MALGTTGGRLMALSRDGRAGAGSLVGGDTGGFRWTEAQGIEPLPGAMSVHGMSASGRYVAGSSLDAEQREVASYWNADGAIVRLGGLQDVVWQSGLVSIAFGISDEPRVVGVASDPSQRTIAFEWSTDHGMRPLSLPAKTQRAHAEGISEDGLHAYGWIEPAVGPRRGVLWNQGLPQLLSQIGNATLGEVLGGNRSLTVLLGVDLLAGNWGESVYRWRAETGSQRMDVPTLQWTPLRLLVSSDDGGVLAGSAGTGATRIAVIWTRQTGVQPLAHLLAARGITIPAAWTLSAATGVSGDGRRIGGWGLHSGKFESFVVDLPVPATSSR